MRKEKKAVLWWLAVISAAVFFVTGCGTPGMEQVRTRISNTELMLQRAKQNEAEKYAPLELKLAEEQLEEARAALEEEEVEEATVILEEAMMRVRLAEQKAQTAKAKERAQDKEEYIDTLREEMDRTVE